MSGEGSESAYWQRWADAFEPFLSHPNARVRRIAERGKRDIDERVKRGGEAERLEAISWHRGLAKVPSFTET